MSTKYGHQINAKSLVLAVVIAVGVTGLKAEAQQVAPQPSATPNHEYHPTSAFHGGYPQGTAASPMAELQVLPGARAAASATQVQLHSAQANLNIKMSDLRRASGRSQEMVDATNEERAAWDALNAARKQALADLRNDPTYQAVVELRDKLAEQIEQTRHDPQTPAEQRRALAEVKLSHATTVTAMETSAIAADPQVQAARQRLVAAGDRLVALRQAADDSLRSNPDVLAARKDVQNAQAAALAADSYFEEARNVAKVSVDYAYDLYFQPRPYSVLDPYYGYGYGLTTGYPTIGAGSGGYPYAFRATSP